MDMQWIEKKYYLAAENGYINILADIAGVSPIFFFFFGCLYSIRKLASFLAQSYNRSCFTLDQEAYW